MGIIAGRLVSVGCSPLGGPVLPELNITSAVRPSQEQSVHSVIPRLNHSISTAVDFMDQYCTISTTSYFFLCGAGGHYQEVSQAYGFYDNPGSMRHFLLKLDAVSLLCYTLVACPIF